MRACFLALICLLGLPSFVFAWGGDGHQIVALIAEERLTPAAKAGIKALLGDANISDAEIASWADELRRERRSTAPWHYVDIPIEAASFDKTRDGRKGNNVIDKIEEFSKVLADKNATKADRIDALKLLVHLVGDVHQPLHCAERNKDAGGNARLVFFLERKTAVNLHQCWDSLILLNQKGKIRVAEYADKLNAKISKTEATKWAKGKPEDWANETHKVAVDSAYAGIPADGPPPKLTPKYIDTSALAIDEQLEKAGVRLAMILNRALSK